jgi:F0F1-type ATP synthase gamma subunit
MTTVKQIVKITKSSKMIAAAKMRTAQSALAPARTLIVCIDLLTLLSVLSVLSKSFGEKSRKSRP